MTKGRKPAPANESNADRFKRVGGIRVQNALDALEKIENLANPNVYEYNGEQVEKICEALENAVIRVRNKLEGKTERQRRMFKL